MIHRVPFLVFALAAVLLLAACEESTDKDDKTDKNPVVVMKTTMGDIEIELFPDAAPETVKNFIELAEGKKPWRDPSGRSQTKPFYDGLAFHRVIDGFMVQGGCPRENGTGDPGYKFKDEINAKALGLDKERVLIDVEKGKVNELVAGLYDLRHPNGRTGFQRDIVMPLLKKLGIPPREANSRMAEWQPDLEALTLMQAYENMGYEYDDSLTAHRPVRGVIAMANNGPNTNGSQFFINVKDTPHLTGRHTVFGKVVKGMDVVDAIAKVKVDQGSKPVKPVRIVSIRVKK